jgi:hypothetical protein
MALEMSGRRLFLHKPGKKADPLAAVGLIWPRFCRERRKDGCWYQRKPGAQGWGTFRQFRYRPSHQRPLPDRRGGRERGTYANSDMCRYVGAHVPVGGQCHLHLDPCLLAVGKGGRYVGRVPNSVELRCEGCHCRSSKARHSVASMVWIPVRTGMTDKYVLSEPSFSCHRLQLTVQVVNGSGVDAERLEQNKGSVRRRRAFPGRRPHNRLRFPTHPVHFRVG